MNCQRGIALLFVFAVWVAGAHVPAGAAPPIPVVINHQGVVKVDDMLFSGSGQFRFAIHDGSENLWTNDGTALGGLTAPDTAVAIDVVDGVYSVLLGKPGTTAALPDDLFSTGSERYLRVWFDDGTTGVELLEPDQVLVSVPYAFQTMHAATASHAESVAWDSIDARAIADGSVTADDLADGAALADVLDQDGAGSGLDADTLDGQQAADFMAAAADEWVNEAGDTMTGPLTVEGAVTVERVQYSTPREHTYQVTEADFTARKNDVDYWIGLGMGGVTSVSNDTSMVAPVHLPNGATITEMTAYICKGGGATTDLTVSIFGLLLPDGIYSVIEEVNSSDITDCGTASATDIGHLVNHTSLFYTVNVSADDWTDLRLLGVNITYTLDEAP